MDNSKNFIVPLLGSIFVQVLFVASLYLLFSLRIEAIPLLAIPLMLSIASFIAYPFFRGEQLFWRKETPIPLWAWVLHNVVLGLLLYVSLYLLSLVIA